LKKLTLVPVVLLFTGIALAQNGAIILVRHAEKESQSMTSDVPLSAIGRARAQCLAHTLRSSHVTGVIVSDLQRTRQTTEPLLAANHLTPMVIPARDTQRAVQEARKLAAGGNVLIVGHSDTLPAMLSLLGFPGIKIPDDAYDEMFIVVPGENPSLLELRYCPAEK